MIFLKNCISDNVDGCENDFIYICGLKGYTLPQPESESHLKSSDESDGSEWIKTWINELRQLKMTIYFRHYNLT